MLQGDVCTRRLAVCSTHSAKMSPSRTHHRRVRAASKTPIHAPTHQDLDFSLDTTLIGRGRGRRLLYRARVGPASFRSIWMSFDELTGNHVRHRVRREGVRRRRLPDMHPRPGLAPLRPRPGTGLGNDQRETIDSDVRSAATASPSSMPVRSHGQPAQGELGAPRLRPSPTDPGLLPGHDPLLWAHGGARWRFQVMRATFTG